MSVHELKGLTELCHFTTIPVLPDNVSSPLELPEQTEVPPETDPPAEAGSTVTVVAAELAEAQLPLWTTALNWVVCVNTPEV